MSLTESIEKVKHLFGKALEGMTGSKKRKIAAEIAKEYGNGGQTFVANEYNISRTTIRKGTKEIETGEEIKDAFNQRGRKKAIEKLPQLEENIRKILESQSQTDPKFQTDRLYTNITIKEIRNQLIKQYVYTDKELPTERTLDTIVNKMKYTVKAVKKSEPHKKVPENDLIFENLQRIHTIVADDEDVIRLSIDTKDRVKIGNFSRDGNSRVEVKAADHDFGDKHVIPFGIMNVKDKDVGLSISETKVTADFMVDQIEEYWVRHGYDVAGKKLLLNADNGPENSSQRTQFIKRMIEFSMDHNTEVTLLYYPPYHSKYNPIERVWGALEQHWNGSLLDSKETVIKYAESMTYDKKHPTVTMIDKVYETGVKVNKKVMKIYEKAIDRIAGLEKWFVRISPAKCREVLSFIDLSDS